MNTRSTPWRRAALVTLGMMAAVPVQAQEVVARPTPNADRLAEEMRVLAREPRNVRALIAAGEYSARLDEAAAAAGFFARAEALDPNNPRLAAGRAMVMVRMEKPGQALRLFSEAERGGVAMAPYASDRGLAYDLIGAQAHAQREHRIAMRDDPDDETTRRYALSLGISGQTDEALRVLDALLRRSDRAAWRARAFIQAMNGDTAGADKIAASMMGGFGTALSPFFRRLPTMSAADKAFAVHFGELRRTPARVADALTAPPLPALPSQPGVAVASVRTPDPATRTGARASNRRGQAAREASAARTRQLAEAKAAQDREAQRQAEVMAQEERAALAARQQQEAQRLAEARAAEAREAEARRLAEAQQAAEAARLAEAQRVAEAARVAEVQRQEREAAEAATRQAAAQASAPVTSSAVTRAASSAGGELGSPSAPGFNTPSPAATASASRSVDTAAPATPARRVGSEDNVIARIMAGITIPASELGVQPMPGDEPAPAPEPAPVSTPPQAAPQTQPAPEATPPSPSRDPVRKAEGVAQKPPAAATKPARAKAAPAKPDPAKTDPARHWVQVAGGANVNTLPREWARLVKAAPVEFRGKQAWTTPLRFTNRLLVGPFKSAGAAQEFVNDLAKKDLPAFAWTSEAGQKIEKLPAK